MVLSIGLFDGGEMAYTGFGDLQNGRMFLLYLRENTAKHPAIFTSDWYYLRALTWPQLCGVTAVELGWSDNSSTVE